jgi:hypothetical protein
MDTVYSIQSTLIKLGVAIAFCIGDYKGNEEAIRQVRSGKLERLIYIALKLCAQMSILRKSNNSWKH